MEMLTRQEIRTQLEQFVQGTLGAPALAAWAFKQVADEAEELITYEPGMEDLIDEVLDELVWADSEPFILDVDTARQLLQKLPTTL